jgi:hypothetical protein
MTTIESTTAELEDEAEKTFEQTNIHHLSTPPAKRSTVKESTTHSERNSD